ncbi:Asparagine--tRNA ligase, cytoplasmic; AltName: Full=Asparaginyl-tRNA synthetase; Short=AsnRS [Serendipita indica DSM 11827]|uniref:asparagine--tRNA ligase n=1 Tax=Serendipita indica (strain DSM 11827) TaxID=1109443 RepID=G4THV6_SERID|nr:Asparagine--tRNA ligase, cytoplasmic; AltName: Full=Asparaginyl-tRNA synthetase; Short=AsnRS [Serendipita indica DSM 11827]CCA70889.1 probable DED81-asparaginyl-tRNA-synthetase [Serendipita indica DSM 11827]
MASTSTDTPTDAVTVYVDEKVGSDDAGDGSIQKPYQSAAQAIVNHGPSPPLVILTRKSEEEEWVAIGISALKKARKGAEGIEKKRQKALAAEAKAAEKAAAQEKAKDVVLEEDLSLPQAVKTKIKYLEKYRGQRVRISGWVHRLRSQGKMIFVVLRDGTGFLQVIIGGKLSQVHDASLLTNEATIEVVGNLQEVPAEKSAPGGHEVVADYWKVIGHAPLGDDSYLSRFNEETGPSILADLRHLVLRGETQSAVLKLRTALLSSFRHALDALDLKEVTPPCIVQTQVEGGATLFGFKYYEEEAYLTQSSQLYLETVLPALGDVYCVQESFRAEKSQTRRHLSEFTHLEAELAFITFDDLMTHIENAICDTIDHLLATPGVSELMKVLNPDFKPPSRPFLRMSYADAIQWLVDHKIQHVTEETEDLPDAEKVYVDHVLGDDIAEAAERKMTDEIGRPIFLYGFPSHLKAFYMQKMKGPAGEGPNGMVFTESCDLLMPGVGEVVGGSMRIHDADELLAAFKKQGIPAEPYYWYVDQRRYGTCEHGGYGLGVERFLAWIGNRYTVRECQLYGRWPGRATP